MDEVMAEYIFFLILKESYTDMKWKRIFLKIYFKVIFYTPIVDTPIKRKLLLSGHFS